MFGRIAPSYDSLNHILSLGLDLAWRSRMAKSVKGLPQNGRVLDLCTGTGDQAFAILKKWPHLKVIGVDSARPMLAIAQKKRKNRELGMVQASALDLPFEGQAFDACFCSFGLRNVQGLPLVIKEVRRVLKNEGLLLVLDFFKPLSGFERFFYGVLAPTYIPWLGSKLSGDSKAYRYLVSSVGSFVTKDGFVEILKDQGFVLDRQKRFFFGVAHGIVAFYCGS
jgi:ubiquinone/menaquinone biosynthesis methyltransferase